MSIYIYTHIARNGGGPLLGLSHDRYFTRKYGCVIPNVKNGDLNLHLRYIEHMGHMNPYGKK